jgi:hypothetical protein
MFLDNFFKRLMEMKRNKLYIFLLISIAFGYAWLVFSNVTFLKEKHIGCLFKKVTTYPCPSCGTTRSVQLVFNGEFFSSLLLNPFGILVATIMLVVPFWIGIDLIKKSDSFFKFYKASERFISKKPIAILLFLLVILNWYWNIKKNI